jgi:ribosomal protein S18 acetylase RimI-like enzyme
MAKLSIRWATTQDASALAEVAAETFPLACPPGTTEQNILLFMENKLSIDAFQGYLANPNYRLWLAVTDAGCAGYAMAIHGEPEDPDIAAAVATRPTMELSKIYVRVEHHGHGASQELMSAVLEEGHTSGVSSVWLGVNKLNERANRFYQNRGFEVVGTRYFQVGDSQEADYVREFVL